jgi:23S rRNA pseudouridine1911/1915/1917 synthase
MRWTWFIPEASAAGRADLVISEALARGEGEWSGEGAPPISRSRVQKLIEDSRITADGAPIRANTKLKPGARLELDLPAPKAISTAPEDRPLEILFQDEHLLVVNKPPGLTVHPSATQTEGTLVNILLHHIKDLSGIGGALRPGIVHRIDKDTSGALVVSKTDTAHHKLTEIFARHAIERRYWAFCFGAPAERKGQVSGNIGRNPTDRKKMAIVKTGGRSSTSFYEMLEKYSDGKRNFASWLEVTLETGRTHQVRVHLTSIGHSLLGDPVYGTPTEKQPKWTALPAQVREAVRALPGQALHARVLGFEHPITGEKLRFEAEVPPSLKALMEELAKWKS